MSDNEEEKTGTTEAATKQQKKREPKKGSIPKTEIDEMVKGIPQYEKTSFLVVGHKTGVRLAIPLTAGVSRVYFYGNEDYSIIPDDEAITVFDEANRKDNRRGGIMAQIDFDKGLDAARRALGKLVEVVRNAPTPAAKPKKATKEQPAAPDADAADAAQPAEAEASA